ncbi:hypothetical protein EDB81DRAFT_381537 [Dactylonectria macrodidyma]|uniref:Uncharacterized protein n=1 Tax=Dactylonectria macrodidyma TaxID=307937 RepID=A0A9P9F9H9_9HYPO|nr:hypothetical protein EDB81DRAFT_381537 [Dactylonectria macrodidyma]
MIILYFSNSVVLISVCGVLLPLEGYLDEGAPVLRTICNSAKLYRLSHQATAPSNPSLPPNSYSTPDSGKSLRSGRSVVRLQNLYEHCDGRHTGSSPPSTCLLELNLPTNLAFSSGTSPTDSPWHQQARTRRYSDADQQTAWICVRQGGHGGD